MLCYQCAPNQSIRSIDPPSHFPLPMALCTTVAIRSVNLSTPFRSLAYMPILVLMTSIHMRPFGFLVHTPELSEIFSKTSSQNHLRNYSYGHCVPKMPESSPDHTRRRLVILSCYCYCNRSDILCRDKPCTNFPHTYEFQMQTNHVDLLRTQKIDWKLLY